MWKSRKFKMTILALVGIAGSVWTGDVSAGVGIQSAVAAIAAYVLGVAIEDAGAKSAG